MDEPTVFSTDIGQYAIVPLWLVQSDISHTALRVFALLAGKYANRTTQECWPSHQRIADDLHVHRNTVAAGIAELVERGILVQRHRAANGLKTSNHYTLQFIKPAGFRCTTDSATLHNPLCIVAQPTVQPLHNPLCNVAQPTVHKPESVDPELVNQKEVPRAPVNALVESPLAWHKRHGSHVQQFCDWVCFPQELASQFANRASLTDADILTWAQSVRQTWQQAKKVPTGSMYDFWNARWAERQNVMTTDADSFAERHRRRREREAEEEQKKQEAYRKWQARVRAEMAEMARLREEIEREQQQSGE
jgi:hypothetical protein